MSAKRRTQGHPHDSDPKRGRGVAEHPESSRGLQQLVERVCAPARFACQVQKHQRGTAQKQIWLRRARPLRQIGRDLVHTV